MNTLKSIMKWTGAAAVCLLFFSSTAWSQSKLTDPEIASVAVTANQIDVNYGKIAVKKSKSPEIRKFAETMIKDHTDIIKQAVALATKLHVTPKTNATTKSLLEGEKKTTKLLNSKKGKAFDKAYIDNEVAYHKAVINAVQNVLIPDSQNQELKDLLTKVMPLLNSHLQMAENTQAEIQGK
ncbi:MAG: DUF4142 domain-containing protein [Chitinophagaceae bacterium]|jgi:putative membrane protein|nr:MAG: DUF4142 domain-containing protein [Chitinophagaceae bacterium]